MLEEDVLSRQILLGPPTARTSANVAMHREDNPDLEDWHPLARVSAFLDAKSGRPKLSKLRSVFNDGLALCDVINRCPEHREFDNTMRTETVAHEMTVRHRGRVLRLQFQSTGEMWSSDHDAPEKLAAVPLKRMLAHGLSATTRPEALYAMWEAQSKASPAAYSKDSGGEIGGMRYRLVRINGVPIARGSGWSDECSEVTNDQADGEDDYGVLRLGQLLSRSESRALRIGYPDDAWRIRVTPERLAASYQKGRVLPCQLIFRVMVADSDDPLIAVRVKRSDVRLPEPMRALLKHIERLRRKLSMRS